MKHTNTRIFNALATQEQFILERLSNLIATCDGSTDQKALERMRRILELITLHLNEQDELISCVNDRAGVSSTVESYESNKRRILGIVGELTMLSPGDPGMIAKLKKLAGAVHVLAELEDTRLHRQIRRHISAAELAGASVSVFARAEAG